MLETSDGGSTWRKLPEPPAAGSISFASEREGWLAGGPGAPQLYSTNDGGATWGRVAVEPPEVNADASDLAFDLPTFRNEREGTLPVTFIKSGSATVGFYETADGGRTWRLTRAVPVPGAHGVGGRVAAAVLGPDSFIVASPDERRLAAVKQGKVRDKAAFAAAAGSEAGVLELDFKGAASGWLLVNEGRCADFKSRCSQTTKLLATSDGGASLSDITPKMQSPEAGFPPLGPFGSGPPADFATFTSKNRYGFDKCAADTVSNMSVWWSNSPYYDANIYIGGANRGCSQSNLNSSWVSQTFTQGWGLIPTWVGPQATCTTCTSCSVMSSDANTAASQGVNEANAAANAAAALGLSNTIIYYDMERYNPTTSCQNAVRAFVNGWVQQMHARGNLAGVYGSPQNAQEDWRVVANAPDAVWIAKWDDRVTVSGLTPLEDIYWANDQRIHQYHGGHNETYGGVTFNIDNDYDDAPVAGPGAQSLPNLTPYQPSGWSDKIVVSTASGSNTDSTTLKTTDTLYVDWAVTNNGSASTAVTFYTKLYVDGVEKTSWQTNPPLGVNSYAYIQDYSIGSLSAGTHTVKIVTDATSAISESSESDNEYTKTISVTSGTPTIRISPTTLTFSQTANAPAAGAGVSKGLQTPELSARPSVAGAEEGLHGTPMTAESSGVVNFSELARAQAAAPAPAQERRFIPEPEEEEEEEQNRLVPPGAKVVREESPAVAAAAEPLGPSPTASPNFQGTAATGWYPPDIQGAAGPNHLTVAANGGVRVQTKTGGDAGFVRTLASFFSTVANGSTDVFDPRIQYDPYGGRWILIAAADRDSASSALMVGVSQTSDPTGSWNVYRVDVDSSDQTWADYPMLGFNKNWIVISANMIPKTGSSAAYHARFFVMNKASLYAGGTPTYTQIVANGVSGNIMPSSVYDANASTMYLLQTWSGNTGGSGYLRLYSLSGAVGSEVLNNVSSAVLISTPNPWDGGGGNIAPQLNSSDKIQINDASMQNVVYRNGSLWCVHTVFLPAGGATRSSVQWWQIEPTAPSVQQRGRIDDSTGNVFYGYPSIAVNSSNDVLVGYSRFSSAQYAGAGYAFRAGTDAANTMRDDTPLKAGGGTYYSADQYLRNRWGDYSAAVVDPADDKALWTIQEYAASTDTWGTWWGRITPPGAGASNTFTIFNDGTATLTVNGISKQNNSSWLTVSTPSQLPFDIAPGSSAQVSVSVNAAGLAAGSYSDRLLVTSNDGARSPYPDGVNVNLGVTSQPPAAPVATAATNVTGSGFTANWNGVSGANGYRLDVSTSSTFASYVSGYQNLDAGNALSRSVGGLNSGTTYYYRVRAYNGGGTSNDSNVINTTTTQTYTITLSASPPAGGTVGGGGSFAAGTSRTVTATPNAGYSFSNWTEGGVVVSTSAGYTFTLNSDRSLVANFTSVPTNISVTVQTSPAGLAYTVDGVTYTAGQVFSWAPGASHTIGTTSPQSGAAGTRYAWGGWSDGGAMSHTVAPNNATTYTANFTTQYFLTTSAGSGGTVSPASNWYNSGQTVSVSATPNGGYTFNGWAGSGSGSYTGNSNPVNISMNGPVTEVADFKLQTACNPDNLALACNGAVATASSSYSSNYPASAVNDGDRRGLNWNAGGGWNDATPDSYPDWAQVDFGASKSVGEVDVFTLQDNPLSPVEPGAATTFTQYGVTSFDVQYWTGAAWVTVPDGSVTGNNLVWRKFTFPAVTTSKVRVLVNGALAGYSRLTEVEAYATPRTNVALASNGGVATASSSYNSNYPASAVNNGDRRGLNWNAGGGWNDATADAYPDWVQVAFSGVKTIDEIDVYTLQDNAGSPVEPTDATTFTQYGITAFDVQYWDDALGWRTVSNGSVTGNNRVKRTFSFAAVSTSKVRVLVNGALAGYSRVVEVEAFESSGAASQRVNVALSSAGSAAVASSTFGAGYPASAVNDGDRRGLNWNNGGGWNDATPDSYPDWVQINFGGSKRIDEINVYTLQDNPSSPVEPDDGTTFSLYGITDYRVEYWDDFWGWVAVPNGVVTGNRKVKRAFPFPAVTTNKIRVLVNGALAGYSRITEVEAFEARPNVASASSGATATASSSFNSNYPASAVNDGDRRGLNWNNGGGWNDATPDSYPDWVQVDFGTSRTISEVDVFTLQDNPGAPAEPNFSTAFSLYGVTAFDVQYWNGTAWVTVPGGGVTGNSLVWRRVSFTPVTTSRIRVLVNGALAGYSRLTEVEAY